MSHVGLKSPLFFTYQGSLKCQPHTTAVFWFFHSGLNEVVLIIQSQRNSYHARHGLQKKAEILQQAAAMGQVIKKMSEDIY